MFPTLKDLPDNLLLKQCTEGNDIAFNVLFRCYFTKLYKYTLSFTKNGEIAEELVMDVMLNLWLKKENIILQDSLGPYIFRAMKNALINHWRKKAIQTTTLVLTEDQDYADPRSADYEMATKELDNSYDQQVNALSPQRKKVFELSRKENMTYPEIAGQLNLSVKTVENHISAALAFLRENLKVLSDSASILLIFLFI